MYLFILIYTYLVTILYLTFVFIFNPYLLSKRHVKMIDQRSSLLPYLYIWLMTCHIQVLECVSFSLFTRIYTGFIRFKVNFTFNIHFFNQKIIHDVVKSIHVSRKSIHVKPQFWLPAGHTRRGRHTVIQIEPTQLPVVLGCWR